MDGETPRFGPAEAVQERVDPIEGEGTGLAVRLTGSLEIGESEEVVDGGAIVHSAAPRSRFAEFGASAYL